MIFKNRKKFLFGRLYTIVDNVEDKKDDSYITEKDVEKIYKTKTIYEINKNNYLNDYYVKFPTKQTEYYLYNSSILYNELAREKDVSLFSTSEIKDLIESVPTGSKGQQYRVYKFINQYCAWMVANGFINYNPCDSLDKKDFNANIKVLQNKIIGLDKFWEMINVMTANGAHVQLVLPLVLSRYGIYGNRAYDILSARYEDIDKENKTITLHYPDGTFKTSLLIDDRFINIVEKSKTENEVDSDYKAEYRYTGYIIRRSSLAGKDADDKELIGGLVRRAKAAYEFAEGWHKIKYNNLVKSRKLDFIFNIRRNRRINTEDVLNVIRIFEPKASSGSYHSLVADIESLLEEKVLFKYEKGAKLIDNNASEFMDKVIDRLDFKGGI